MYIYITVVHRKQGFLLYRLCACPIIPEIYVVEGPKACLANEEVSLGKAPRKANSAANTEDTMLLVGGDMSRGRDCSLDYGYLRMSHVGLALEHLRCQETLWLTQSLSVR